MPFLSIFKKKEKPKFFLALILREDKVNAVLFEELLGKVKILSQDEAYFKESIEDASDEEFLSVIDKTVSVVEEILPFQIETHQTVFGLKENWTNGASIKKEYLLKLKKICEKLGFSPIGFMVIPEAITHLLQKEEGAPVSAILVEVGKQKLIGSLIRAGRVVETKIGDSDNNIAQSTDTLLKSFDADILPSRIILFDDSYREDLLQKFIAHKWSKSLPFLHVPQTTNLPKNFATQAVIVASASQMGFDILDKPDFNIESTYENQKEKTEEKEKTEKEETEDLQESIDEKEMEGKKEEEQKNQDYQEVNPEELGFSKKGEIANNEKVDLTSITIEEKVVIEKPFFLPLNFSIKSGKKILSFVLKFKPQKLFAVFEKMGKGFFIVPLILGLLLLLLLGYLFGLNATVILELKPKSIEQNQNVIFSTSSDSDFSKNILHAELVKTTKDGEESTTTTGKKEVGEKAKGSITIYSRFQEEKTFPQGTIVSYNDLDFTFDNAVSVASTSADASASPSTSKASVTATRIGKEYNLPSGSKFSIGNFPSSTVIAKNDSAFSGGSKKEVAVVSKDDVDKLTEKMIKNLEDKAKEDLLKVIPPSSQILPTFISQDLIKKDLNKEIGQEASSVNLKGTVEFVGISFRKEDLTKLGESTLKNKFPSNLSIAPNGVKVEVANIKQKNDKQIIVDTKLQGLLLPNIDSKNLTKNLAGKSFLQAEDFLLKLPQVSNVKIALKPNIPFLPKILPRLSRNIVLTTKVNE